MWRRREVLGVLGTGAAGLAIITSRLEAEAAWDDKSGEHDSKHASMLKECDEACGHCSATCNATFHHCVTQAAMGKVEHAKMAQMVSDCAAFCALSAEMISRHSKLMVTSCRACAEACRRCAQECASADTLVGRFPRPDEMMKACIESCRRCEESCRKMIQAMGGEHDHESGQPATRRSS